MQLHWRQWRGCGRRRGRRHLLPRLPQVLLQRYQSADCGHAKGCRRRRRWGVGCPGAGRGGRGEDGRAKLACRWWLCVCSAAAIYSSAWATSVHGDDLDGEECGAACWRHRRRPRHLLLSGLHLLVKCGPRERRGSADKDARSRYHFAQLLQPQFGARRRCHALGWRLHAVVVCRPQQQRRSRERRRSPLPCTYPPVHASQAGAAKRRRGPLRRGAACHCHHAALLAGKQHGHRLRDRSGGGRRHIL